MSYLYLLFAIVFSAMLSIMTAAFNKKNHIPNIANLYNVIYMASALICWMIMYITDFCFEPKVLLYSLGYGICYAVTLIGLFNAIKCGSVSLTSFIKQLSFVGVAIWGFIFWDSPITLTIAIALFLIAIALFLCFKNNKTQTENSITFKWLVYILMLFVGNAGCSIVQKYQQMAFDGKYKYMLMFFAVAFAMLFCLLFLIKNGIPHLKSLAKGSFKFPIFAGVSSALVNLFILLLANTNLSPAVIYPCIAVGGMILAILVSVIIYKERLMKIQWVGLSVGVVAIVFLNI